MAAGSGSRATAQAPNSASLCRGATPQSGHLRAVAFLARIADASNEVDAERLSGPPSLKLRRASCLATSTEPNPAKPAGRSNELVRHAGHVAAMSGGQGDQVHGGDGVRLTGPPIYRFLLYKTQLSCRLS